MWTLALQLVFIGLNLQVSSCYQSCTLYHGLIAKCSSQHHEWVPILPPNITHLFLEYNYISEINSSSLRAYDQLIKLDLGSQYVPLVIRSNSFLRQKKLTRLVLGNNTGLQLELKSFVGLHNLQQLFLDHCDLTESILAESYLQPLWSLKTLNLFGNRIVRLRPGPFFSRLTKLTELNLKLNRIERLCEEDLAGFRGKNFAHLDLNSNRLAKTYCGDFDWESCGNPFRGMAFNVLDLSSNGICMKNLPRFFKSIEGTPIHHLIFSGHMGKDFSHDNLDDPDENTFEGLMNSSINVFDLSKNRIFALKMAVFSPLKNARTIDISNNKINQIKRNAFNGLQGHLRILTLSSNLLGEIYDYTFTNLTNLRALNLSHNYIGVLGYNAFKDLPELQLLDLTGNSLRDLGFPVSLPNMQYLLLADNKLKSLYSINVLGINSIHVDVRDNRLNSLGDVYIILSYFPHLQNFLYGGNNIKWCSHSEVSVHGINSWNSLKVLDLHDSSLQIMWTQGQCLDLFDHLENLLGLNLTFNSLTTLPQGIFSGLRSVIEIDLSFNELTYLQTDVFPASLLRLYLTSNFLASPDPTTFRSVIFLSLEANRFHCDCHLESFLKWLNVTNITFLSSVEEYRCEFPAAFRNRPLLNYSTIVEPCEQDDEKAVQGLKLALFIFSALSIIMVVFSGIVYARLRGHIFIIYKKIAGRVLEGPKPTIPVDEVQYDAYFCFSDSDYRWVEAALLKKLDNQFSEENIFRCCFEARDFLPGEDHMSNIRDAIWGSRKTVCIVSKEFLKDGWCLEAFALAQGRMLEELTNVLILLVVGKLAHYQLMKCKAIRAFVQRREYLTWPEDPQDLEWFYERLVSQMLKDTKVKKLAEDKPEPEPEPEPEPVQPDVHSENEEDGIELQNVRAIAL